MPSLTLSPALFWTQRFSVCFHGIQDDQVEIRNIIRSDNATQHRWSARMTNQCGFIIYVLVWIWDIFNNKEYNTIK